MGSIAMGHQSISGRKHHKTYQTLVRKVHVFRVDVIVDFSLAQVGEAAVREGATVSFLLQVVINQSLYLDTVRVVLE